MRLGKVCFLKSGKNVTAKDIYDKPDVGLFPCYGGNGLRGYVDKFNYDGKYNLIGRQGALCGNINRATGRFYATEHAVVVTPLIPLDDDWLYYALVGMNLNQYHTGAAQPGLNIDILNNVEINVPSLAVQRYQAIILNKVSEIITSRKQELRLLDDLIKARFVEMFGDFKLSPKWELKRISSVCEEVVDCINKTAPVVDYKTQYKMLRTTNVRNGYVDVENVKYVEQEVFDKWTRRSVPHRGDLLLTREAPVGEVGIVRSDDNIFLGQRLVSYRANKDHINAIFLMHQMMTQYFQDILSDSAKGSTVKHIPVPDCTEFLVYVPPIDLQNQFAAFVTQIDKTKATVQKALDEAQLLFDSLMQKYFG